MAFINQDAEDANSWPGVAAITRPEYEGDRSGRAQNGLSRHLSSSIHRMVVLLIY